MRSGGSAAVRLALWVLCTGSLAGQASIDLGWVRIDPGSFQMGCVPTDMACRDDEQPRHEVTISTPFDVMATEVTVAQYARFVQATGHPSPPRADFPQGWDHPVVLVTWPAAAAFCDWAGGRLPTEAEWEFAARAGHAARIYWWGDELSRDWANFGTDECCNGAAAGADQWVHTAPVGSLPPNDFGLHDVAGNVWEWVADWHGGYPMGATVDPRGAGQGFGRIARGGSWLNVPGVLRVSVRLVFSPNGRTSNVGMRCARDLAGQVPAE